MFKGCSVGVVVPAFNEEQQIDSVLDTMPAMVDSVIVVDDGSADATSQRCLAHVNRRKSRVTLVRHEKCRGVGAAIASGYQAALESGLDIVAVMAGDGQMDPCELELIVEPVANGRADYTKGNRLFTGKAWERTPRLRYLGNAFLSLLTKMASGYWHVADSQTGYTAISRSALQSLDLGSLYPRYGYPNDVLIKLNVANCRVADIPINPRYGIGEKSSMKIWKVIPTVSMLLFRGFLYRMLHKYVIRDFHPLVFFYFFGTVLLWAGLILGLVETYAKITHGDVAVATIVLVALLGVSGLQLLLFGMWFDMEYNKELRDRFPDPRAAA